MNLERYTTPAIIAGAAHAALFLSAPNVPAVVRTDDEIMVLREFRLPEHVIPAEPTEVQSDDRTVRTPRGVELPSLPDEIKVRPEPTSLPMPDVGDYQRQPGKPVKVAGPPGRPDGTDGGEWGLSGPLVLQSGLLDRQPQYRARAAPEYPFEARRAGLEGEVLVEFEVAVSGRISAARVLKATHRIFEEPALRAVMKWRFAPGTKDGQPVAFRMAVPLHFKLEADEG